MTASTQRSVSPSRASERVLVVNASYRESVLRDTRLSDLLVALARAGLPAKFVAKRRSPIEIAQMVMTNAFDVALLVGFPLVSASHLTVIPRVMTLLYEPGFRRVVVMVGATVTDDDATELKRHGVSYVFTPGLGLPSVIDRVRAALQESC